MSTMQRNYAFVSAVTLFLFCIGSVAHGQATAPTAQIILKKMVARYASASSYQDSGEVRVVPDSPALASFFWGNLQQASFRDDRLVSFKTYYSSPRMFRFEWKSFLRPTSREAIVWFDGEVAYSWMPRIYPKNGDGFTLSSRTDLRSLLEEARGSSVGANYSVPSLLIKDATYFSFADMLRFASQLSLRGEETFDGETCYVIKARIYEVPWMLWIGKESNLLRKTRTSYTHGRSFDDPQKRPGNKYVAEEVHRDIRINESMSKSIFKYRPQLQVQDVDFTRRQP